MNEPIKTKQQRHNHQTPNAARLNSHSFGALCPKNHHYRQLVSRKSAIRIIIFFNLSLTKRTMRLPTSYGYCGYFQASVAVSHQKDNFTQLEISLTGRMKNKETGTISCACWEIIILPERAVRQACLFQIRASSDMHRLSVYDPAPVPCRSSSFLSRGLPSRLKRSLIRARRVASTSLLFSFSR